MTNLGRSIFCVAPVLFAAGCGVTVQNVTPGTIVRNASGIYSVEARVKKNSSAVLDKSVHTELVIWDRTVPMTNLTPSSEEGPSHWTCSLTVPPEQNEIYYYFRVHYQVGKPLVKVEDRQIETPRGAPQKTYLLRITDRMVAGIDSSRARVGSAISVLGKGFTADDHVSVGGQVMPTTFKSPSVLQFQILPMAADQSYAVEVVGAANDVLKAGPLTVDASDFSVIPVALVQGARAWLTIRIPQSAPPGGLPLTLKSSDPKLADLPAEVAVREGKTEAVIKTIGGAVGAGTLTVEALGFHPVTVPISVVANQ